MQTLHLILDEWLDQTSSAICIHMTGLDDHISFLSYMFASYALTIDDEYFVMEDMVRIRDPHASEENMQEYIELLKSSGFSEATEEAEDGTQKTYYRKLLREAYACYSSIELSYEDGLNLTACKYYDSPSYDGLEAINAEIGRFGYAALPSSPDLQLAKARDEANAMSESWLYFFHYDLGMYADLTFADEEKATAYMKSYEEELVKAKFHPIYAGDEEEIERYESENGVCSVKYQIVEGTINLIYKVDHHIPPEEAGGLIREAGFPEITMKEPITCRDQKEFQKVQYGQDYKTYLTVSQSFANMQEAEAFLNSYEALLTEAGYGRVSPNEVGTLKQIAIYNEETGHLVGLDVYDEASGVLVNLEFRVR